MKSSLKKLLPHLGVLFVFIVISLAYFSPVLNGKEIKQSDIAQYIGMSKQHKDFNKSSDVDTYWTNAAFGGMPTYQLGAKYPHNYIKKLDLLLRFLPRPADYLFLYFLCFYILLLVLKTDWKYALLGSLAFGFSTYFIVILGVGHNAKAHAIAYMPLVLSGIFLAFQKKYVLGGIITALAMALELNANHFQMTYYLLLLVLVIGTIHLITAYRQKELVSFAKAIAVLCTAVFFSLALNATHLLATSEYAKESTRSKSELTINSDGSNKALTTGLDKAYITEYSYGIGESFNLFVPRLFGGSNNEPLAKDAIVVKKMQSLFGISSTEAEQFGGQLMYWADQSYVAAPAYIGATILFLFVLALFIVKAPIKKWVLISGGIMLVLSWGKNISFLTDFCIDYIPFYNKFRAVSSMQVIIELVVPLLAFFGLYTFVKSPIQFNKKQKAVAYTAAITVGLSVLFYIANGLFFDFVSPRDGMLRENYGYEFVALLREQRKALFMADVLRTLVLSLSMAIVLWLFLKEKLKENAMLIVLGALILFDLVGVAHRYVNTTDFVIPKQVNEPFRMLPADAQIKEDTTHYNVIDFSTNPFNSARTSYFHNAFGGYHAAKPKRAQDIFDFYISKNDIGVLNMLNIKYIINDKNGQVTAMRNPYANGNAWFVSSLKTVLTADEEILSLGELNLKKQAITVGNTTETQLLTVDSLASIELKSFKPNHLKYYSENSSNGIAVFSEAYYKNGWNAYIDGNLKPHFKVNYLLRGLKIPKGNHTIEFKFEPQVIQTGSRITLITSILLLLLLFGIIGFSFKKKFLNQL